MTEVDLLKLRNKVCCVVLCCVVLCCVTRLYTAIITVSSSFLRIFANYTTVLSACIIQGVVQRISAYDCTQSNIPRLSFAGDVLSLLAISICKFLKNLHILSCAYICLKSIQSIFTNSLAVKVLVAF